MTTVIIEIKDWFLWLITSLIAINTIMGLVNYYMDWRVRRAKKKLKDLIK